jgi:hypothetical protein
VLEQHEQIWNVALQSYREEMARDPELADPGDVFTDWAGSTKVGGYIDEANYAALGSYSRSFDQFRGQLRRSGGEFTATWCEEADEKADLAYRKAFDRAINAHPFTRFEVATYFQDFHEGIDRIRDLGSDSFDQEDLDHIAAMKRQMLSVAE